MRQPKWPFPEDVLAEESAARLRMAVLEGESDDRKRTVWFCSAAFTLFGAAMCSLTICGCQ